MVSTTRLAIVLLLVLPFLAAGVDAAKAKQCSLSVSSTLTDSSSRYSTYSATVTNDGNAKATSISLSTSAELRSLDGLDQESTGTYSLSNQNSLSAGSSYSFTYSVKKGTTVQWAASCAGGSTTAPTTPAPTTKAPTTKAPTTKAPTTKAPTTPAPTTKAPTKAASTTKAAGTTAKAPPTGATTKPTTSDPSTGGDDTGSSSGKKCSSGWWRPAPMTTWQWQLTGTIDTTLDVQVYDIDLFDATSSLIDKLHGSGKAVICYFSTQYENWRPDAASFPASILGSNLDDWVGEKYVDIRSTTLRNIMAARLDLAVSKGCDAVEPDNVDGYQASTGFPLTANDQLDYNKWLANAAHARGLSVGLKNDGDQAAALQPYFDWALNEQCNQYSECTPLNVFISANKAVFNCEYSGSASSVCPKMVTAKFSTLFKSLDLGAAIKSSCCTYASGGCTTKASYSCVSAKKRSQSYVDALEEEELQVVQEGLTAEQLSAGAATYASITLLAAAVAALALLL